MLIMFTNNDHVSINDYNDTNGINNENNADNGHGSVDDDNTAADD